MNPPRWFDAHLDLACSAVNGRDLFSEHALHQGPTTPAAISFPTLAQGRVTRCLGTIFIQACPPAPPTSPLEQDQCYALGDTDAAHAAALRQLALYEHWRTRPGTPRIDILIECADCIRSPDEVPFWKSRGLVAVGLAWVHNTRYAGGNSTDVGLSPDGRSLVHALDTHGIVHDASHLSDRAFDDLLNCSTGTIIASHSNCRSLMAADRHDNPATAFTLKQRHLADEHIRAIAQRNGVIGLNLFSLFLRPNCPDPQRASIDDCVNHIEHICKITGSRRHVGLGSDADGGFSALRLPQGINTPSDYTLITNALHQRGWPDDDINNFAFGNWERVFE